MKPTGRAPRKPRDKSRGVAVIELALSLLFLVPMLMGMLDFGWYFYVASHAEEAARAAARQAVLMQGTTGCGVVVTTTGTVNAVTRAAATSGPGCNTTGGDAACYMHQPPLNLGGVNKTVVTAVCDPAGPVNPTWRITVEANFPPAHGFFKSLFPASTAPGCTGCIKATARVVGVP